MMTYSKRAAWGYNYELSVRRNVRYCAVYLPTATASAVVSRSTNSRRDHTCIDLVTTDNRRYSASRRATVGLK